MAEPVFAERDLQPDPSPRGKPGPRPGERHSGQFKQGHDPRRLVGGPLAKEKIQERQDLRPLVPKAFDTLSRLMDDDQPPNVALQASQTVLDRVFGKAVATSISANASMSDLKELTRSQLNAIAHEALRPLEEGRLLEHESAHQDA